MKYLPRKKFLSSSLIVVLLVALALSPLAAFAAGPQPTGEKYDPSLTETEIRSQFGLSEDVEVVTDSEMSRLIQLCHTIGAYLELNEDGTLALALDNGRAVGVSQSFLNDYEAGLESINALIERGWLTVDQDMNFEPGPQLPASASAIDAELTKIEAEIAGQDAATALPAKESPDYRYRGFMFRFHSRRHSIPYRYSSLGPTFASHFGRGHHGARFSLLFGLHRNFFHRTYRYGGYGYVPYYRYRSHGYHRYYYYTPYSHGRYWRYQYLYY